MYKALTLTILIISLSSSVTFALPTVSAQAYTPSNDSTDGPELHVGGALRYNLFYRDFFIGVN